MRALIKFSMVFIYIVNGIKLHSVKFFFCNSNRYSVIGDGGEQRLFYHFIQNQCSLTSITGMMMISVPTKLVAQFELVR
jgi:hypothetical protein